MLRNPAGRKPLVLKAVRPNLGLAAQYKRELVKLIDEMQKSLVYFIERAYKTNRPEIAQDASPAAILDALMKKLRRRWETRFDEASIELAKYFATKMKDRSDSQLKQILKDGGFSVPFRMTKPMNDVMQATIKQQVGLIKSIAEQHLGDVQGLVMRSVTEGRNAYDLSVALRKRYGVTVRRAALISRSQNNLATATLTRTRQLDLGITQAIWMHSHGGRVPRPSHLANDGKIYDVKKGWFDPDEKKFIFPGQLINCRCVTRSIVPGLENYR